MNTLSGADAYTLVKAAIDAGAIKMVGPSGTVEHAKKSADIDAAYLLRLM